MIVIDASVAMEILIRTPIGAQRADLAVNEDIHVPHLIDVEFVSAVRRLNLMGRLEPATADEALQAMRDWRLQRYGHIALTERIWELRHSHSAYDASYVALAETLDVPLLTCDAKLSRSHGHRAKIELLT